ncbi:MAG: TetR/AcrR family transcriptional regulator [Deltaproteobacteria bacterium]|nr:TetR/AcrR family transcriptional regulator [Deltaproteobacteria bacterium]
MGVGRCVKSEGRLAAALVLEEGVSLDEPEDGRVRRAAERRSQRQEQLLAAARQVFAQKGYHATSVADILERANASRGTFYLYFPSKRAVFEALLDTMFEHIQSAVRRVRTDPDAGPVIDQMRGNVERVLGAVEQNRELAIILLREAHAHEVELDQKVTAFYQRLMERIQGGLRLGQQMGIVRVCDLQTVGNLLLGALKEAIVGWLCSDGAMPRDRFALEILNYVAGAILVQSA